MSGPSAGDLAIGAAGGAIVLAALIDLFVTAFNYDGFSFLANRLHGVLWKTMRTLARPLPSRGRHTVLSLGSASMLPATYVLWLGLLITGFAMLFYAGLRSHGFVSQAGRGIGTAFYLSAGDLTSLTFGDVTARSALMRALVDLETVIGLTTFTLALGYVVTTFDVLKTLDGLHAIVRRHAEDPGKPSSILARHFRGGQPTELPSLLESITEKLEDYDEGLRRYPVVYYFHTRRLARSIPRVFAALGRLVALLRWGLPAEEPMSEDPLLVALIDEYGVTLERLQRSFVGPPDLRPPDPVAPAEFERQYAAAAETATDPGLPTAESMLMESGDANPISLDPSERGVGRFFELQRSARSSAGLPGPIGAPDEATYHQYREWLPFAHRNHVILGRVADALGYEIS